MILRKCIGITRVHDIPSNKHNHGPETLSFVKGKLAFKKPAVYKQCMEEGEEVVIRRKFIILAFHRGQNYIPQGYLGKMASNFWAQWRVFEYEKKVGKHTIQFAHMFVGDGDFTKMHWKNLCSRHTVQQTK